MNREDVRKILFKLRTTENEQIVNYLAGQIDMMTDDAVKGILDKLGNNPGKVEQVLSEKIGQRQQRLLRGHEEHKPINKLYSYGIATKTAHLHLPVQLQDIKGAGITGKINTANLYLIDAIERIAKLKDSGDPKFKDVENIYMISPILVSRQLKFLEDLGFETESFDRKELADPEFVKTHPEAQFGLKIFPDAKNIGRAQISLDKVKSKEWQELKDNAKKVLESKGASLEDSDSDVR